MLPEQLRVRGYDAGLEEEEADVEAQFSDDEAVRAVHAVLCYAGCARTFRTNHGSLQEAFLPAGLAGDSITIHYSSGLG